MSTRLDIGSRLRDARHASGMSLSTVAGRAGISAATLSRIETDKQNVGVDLFVELADIVGAVPGDLLLVRAGGNGGRVEPSEALAAGQLIVPASRRQPSGVNAQRKQQIDTLVAMIDVLYAELLELRKSVAAKAKPRKRS